MLGLLLVILQYFQYRLLMVQYAESWYIGLIALLFTVVGIWAGAKLSEKHRPVTQPDPTSPGLADTVLLAQLNITPRELEVLRYIARGYSNREIAETLFVSTNTIKTHASNVFLKLDARRRTQAVERAKALGLLV
jgi:DNA-binding NarL/FixJ family response regulator